MSSNDGANLDASTFDLDAWIDDVVRPEVTVELYPYEAVYQQKVAAIEAQIPAAERVTPENRGMDDASPEQLLVQLEELRAERSRTALKVRVRQITKKEISLAVLAGKESGDAEADWYLWSVAAACVEPAFTAAQLRRLRDRDVSGESMVAQLVAAINGLMEGLPVPS